MSAGVKKVGVTAFLILFSVVWLSGCGGQKKPEISEVELFAKAQELQKDENFAEAIATYRKLAKEFPNSKQAANSQFMIGYIFANHLNDFEQAKIELNRFIDEYKTVADSGLIAGARFELEHLGQSIDEIPILSNLGDSEPPKTDASDEAAK